MRITQKQIRKLIEDEIKKQMELDEVNPNHDPSTGKFQKKGKAGVYSLTKNAEDDVADDTELQVPARGTHSGDGKSISSKFGMNTSDKKACGRYTIDGKKKNKGRRCRDYPERYAEDYTRSSPESEYIKKKKKETERKNKDKNKKDSIPRAADSPSVRREKVFGGSEPLWSLARGIAEEELEKEQQGDLPRWDVETGKLLESQLEQGERQLEVDDAYLKGLIKQAVLSGIQQARAEAAKQGQKYSWQQVMRLIQDLETAQKGTPKPK